MPKEGKKDIKVTSTSRKSAPARTPEDQEQLMINLSMRQAEEMLRKGNAPTQVVVHFLRLATEKARYENEKLRADTELAKSKAEVLAAQKHSEELYTKAIAAFRSYGGNIQGGPDVSDDDEDFYND